VYLRKWQSLCECQSIFGNAKVFAKVPVYLRKCQSISGNARALVDVEWFHVELSALCGGEYVQVCTMYIYSVLITGALTKQCNYSVINYKYKGKRKDKCKYCI
jgi:hypothetical protein